MRWGTPAPFGASGCWQRQYRYGSCVHTGCYAIKPQDSAYELFQRLYRGHQQPVDLTIGSVRTVGKLLQSMGEQLMIDSAEIADRAERHGLSSSAGIYDRDLACILYPQHLSGVLEYGCRQAIQPDGARARTFLECQPQVEGPGYRPDGDRGLHVGFHCGRRNK